METPTARPKARLAATGPDGREHDWYHGVCHGQNRGTCCGNSRGLPRTSKEVAAYLAVAMDADVRGIASIERPRKLPWQLPRTFADFRGDCRVAVAMAADGRGNCTAVSAEFRGLPLLVRRSLPRKEPRLRAVATTVAFAAEVP